MTMSFQAQQALRLRHMHGLQHGQAQDSGAGDQGRYGNYVFRAMTSPPPPQPTRTGRLPGQRAAGSADRAERPETDADKPLEETGEGSSGEDKIGAQDVRIGEVDFDPDDDSGGSGQRGDGSGADGESGGGAGDGDAQGSTPTARANQTQQAQPAQADPLTHELDDTGALGGRRGESGLRLARRMQGHSNAPTATGAPRAAGRRASSGPTENLSGGRDLERDLEMGFVSTQALEGETLVGTTRVAAVDPDAQGRSGERGDRTASAAADDAARAPRGAPRRGAGAGQSLSARHLNKALMNLTTSMSASPELSSLRGAVLGAGTPQARAQALTQALFVLSASRTAPGPISADAAQLIVMAAYLDAPNEAGPLSTREGVKEALLVQGLPAASALPASTPVRDRMALLPLKLLACSQQRTDAQRQVAVERMLTGLNWFVSPKESRRES